MTRRLDRWADRVIRGSDSGRHARARTADRATPTTLTVEPPLPPSDRGRRRPLTGSLPGGVQPGDRRGTAGTPSLPLLLLTTCVPVVAVVFLAAVGVRHEWADTSSPVGLAVIAALDGAFSFLLATAGVRVRDGRVLVVGLLITTSIPAGRVRTVRWDDGLAVISDDGVEAGTMALGISLSAQLTGHRRQRVGAERLATWIPAHRDVLPPDAVTEIRWRWRAGIACSCWVIVVVAGLLAATFLS